MQVQALGTVAELEVADGLVLHFCVVPAGELGRPLWRPFTIDGAGLVLADLGPQHAGARPLRGRRAARALAVLGASCPDELARRGATAHRGAREAIRAVLLSYAGLTACRPAGPALLQGLGHPGETEEQRVLLAGQERRAPAGHVVEP